MRSTRPLAVAAFAALLLAATGCGGTAGAGGDAASLAPADSLAFLSVDTDVGSSQWHQLDALTGKFPIRAKALQMLRESLRKDPGVDLDQDVRPALGAEVDIAVLKASTGITAVGMLKPDSQQKLADLLAKIDKSNNDGSRTLHEQVAGWTVIADNQAAIDAVKQASNGRSLADVDSFDAAQHELGDAALVKAYVNGAELMKFLPGGGMLAAAQTPQLDWLAARLTAHSDSLEFVGAAKGTGNRIEPYHPKLLADAPSGSIAFASFKGLDRTLKGALASPQAGLFLGLFESQVGMRLQDLVPLFAGEGAIWVHPGAPVPEVTLELEASNEAQALAKLTKLARGIARLTNGKVSTQQTTAGNLTVLSFGRFSVYLAALKGRVLVTDAVSAVSAVKDGGPSLEDDAAFKQALSDAKVPGKSADLFYVNLKGAVEMGLGYAGLAGADVPPEVRANLEPLRALVGFGATSGQLGRYEVFLQTR